MIDTKTGKPRGFGFITFDSHEAVERIVSEPVLILKDKPIEVKRAEPRLKDPNGNYLPQPQPNSQSTSNGRFGNINNGGSHNSGGNGNGDGSHSNNGNTMSNYGNYMGYGFGNINSFGSMTGMNSAAMQGMQNVGGIGNNMSGISNNGMNRTMAIQYFQNWLQYFNNTEQMVLSQGGNNNPNGVQQLQNIKNMKQNLIIQMKSMGLDFDSLMDGSRHEIDTQTKDSTEEPRSNKLESSNLSEVKYLDHNVVSNDISNKESSNGEFEVEESLGVYRNINSNSKTNSQENRDSSFVRSGSTNGEYHVTTGKVDQSYNRFQPRGPKGFNQNYGMNNFQHTYYNTNNNSNNNNDDNNNNNNKGTAAITLLQGEDNTDSITQKSRPETENRDDKMESTRKDREFENSGSGKHNRERYSGREKRHRSRYEEEEENHDSDRGSSHNHHRSSRDRSHKSRDLSLGDRIREDSRENGNRKRHRGEEDKDISSSRRHRSSSRDRDHKSSRHKESAGNNNDGSSKHHRSGSKRSKDKHGSEDSSNGKRESREKDRESSKDRRSKSPPLNAPTGPRASSGSSSFRSSKNYSRRYRGSHSYGNRSG